MKKLLVLSLTLLTAVGGANALSMSAVPSKEAVTQKLKDGYKNVTKFMPSKETIAKTWIAEKVVENIPSKECATQGLYTAYNATKAVPMLVVDSAKRHPYVCIAGASVAAGMLTYVAYKKLTDFSDLNVNIDLEL
ncbi:MAG TPA: hypothetical protein QGF02_04130 [Candidatus Babeliales bacterium]|nr:hypothetical protein [Candidatus Babeliales bacterium]